MLRFGFKLEGLTLGLRASRCLKFGWGLGFRLEGPFRV